MSGLAFQATLVCLLSEDPAQWCAVAELATRMAVAPDTVRMHLWQMQRAGLVELTVGLGATAVTAARIRPAAEARAMNGPRVDCGRCPLVGTGCLAGGCLFAGGLARGPQEPAEARQATTPWQKNWDELGAGSGPPSRQTRCRPAPSTPKGPDR